MDRIEQLETALSIACASVDGLQVDGPRRLTGPGLLWDRPGAIIDLFITEPGPDPAEIVELWGAQARRVLDALGWQDEQWTTRAFHGGVNLAISAPMDQLYSAIFAAQTAWHFCAASLAGQPAADFEPLIADVKGVMAQEANPALIALIAAARDHGVDILCDDDDISVGHGKGSKVWPVDTLPVPEDVDWASVHDLPIAFITGTNGKTTTTRLCAAIARAAGKVAGLTSTDFVRVGDEILDRGDYSGPGGARMLLRDPRLEVACLEVARGGILRRGLPTRQARVAVVTNVANDHLGQYGVNTVPELAQAKFSVHRTLADDGVLVLNADDPFVVAEAQNTQATIWWVSLDPKAPQIQAAQAQATPCAYQAGDGALVFFDGQCEQTITHVKDVPITMDGAARYNVSNVLQALCASLAMGLPQQSIVAGLAAFRPDPKDNPGRCNEFSYQGARVFVDFAHNPHSIAAVCEAVSALPAKRRFITLSHAGDRSDQDIHDVTLTALRFQPDTLIAVEMESYLRGRTVGEIPRLIHKTALEAGMQSAQIQFAPSHLASVKMVLDQLRPGDLALLLVLSERDAVFKLLEEQGQARA